MICGVHARQPTETCSVEGCDDLRESKKRDFCPMHQRRMDRHGDVHRGRPKQELERLCRGACGKVKPIEQFAKQRRVCKTCRGEQERQWRVQNAEHMAAWNREYNQTTERKEKHRESAKRSYRKNRDNRLANRRDYVVNNPDRVKAANRVSEQRRRARMNDLSIEAIESIDPSKVFDRDGWMCRVPRCSASSRKIDKSLRNPDPWSASIDHIIPLKFGEAAGGVHTYANVQCAHLLCNMQKNHTGGGDQLALFGGV